MTLYSALQARNREQVNICSVEDPLEIPIAGMNQTQINPRAGLTFHSVLRALLPDPDIVMVGEIRDAETAEIALKAAQTGHLVLSTLHQFHQRNPDPPAANGHRPLDDFLCALAGHRPASGPASCVPTVGVMPAAPPTCRTACGPARCHAGRQRAAKHVTTDITAGWRCSKCCLLPRATPGDSPGLNAIEIESLARAAGMMTLFESGCQAIEQGLTSLEEVVRVLGIPHGD